MMPNIDRDDENATRYEMPQLIEAAEVPEPVAWMNPANEAVIDKKKKHQIGNGNGYPNFSVALIPLAAYHKVLAERDEARNILKAAGIRPRGKSVMPHIVRAETAERQLAALTNEHTIEWLCEPCKVIHPTQQKGKFLQPCPDCGVGMMPTSFNLRQLAEANKLADDADTDKLRAIGLYDSCAEDRKKLQEALAELREKHERLVARLREPSEKMLEAMRRVIYHSKDTLTKAIKAVSAVALRDSEGG